MFSLNDQSEEKHGEEEFKHVINAIDVKRYVDCVSRQFELISHFVFDVLNTNSAVSCSPKNWSDVHSDCSNHLQPFTSPLHCGTLTKIERTWSGAAVHSLTAAVESCN